MPPPFRPDEAYARALDEGDPLSAFRERFHLPAERYMDGNSLGPLSTDAAATLDRTVREWRELGIGGWTDGEVPWFRYGERLGDRLAPLVGARPDEVIAANSTTVNIHALIGTFLDPARPKVVVDELDFPTDHYAVRAQLRLRGIDSDDALVVVESRDGRTVEEADLIDAMDDDEVGLAFLPSVLYRSGQLLDVPRLAEAARERDVLLGLDLAHSIGVVPHELSPLGVDFAVWCGYKYLNAGPGAVAGLYVNREHLGARPALAGWWGHEKETQFEMRPTFAPADGAGAFQIGTPPILSAAPLFGAVDLVREAGIEAVREKSVGLTDYLIALVDERLPDCAIGTPRDPARRGGHVAVEHPAAYRIGRALRDRGVIVDVRPPNVLRVCPSPLYTRYRDVHATVRHLREVVGERAYERFDADRDGVT